MIFMKKHLFLTKNVFFWQKMLIFDEKWSIFGKKGVKKRVKKRVIFDPQKRAIFGPFLGGPGVGPQKTPNSLENPDDRGFEKGQKVDF